MKLETFNDFESIVLNETPLIDVRAPIEFQKGAFRNAINIPIMDDEDRHVIGICYKEKGNEEAVKLGYKRVSGEKRERIINQWVNFFNNNPEVMIYCFRGGQRSRISQEWIQTALDRPILRLEGGYKAFRNYLLSALEPENIKAKPIILGGNTGSGKTILLHQLENMIDLEGIANHRGSSFGQHILPQPSQIEFENNLAYEIIKHNHKEFKHMVLEDEGRNVGRCFMPFNFGNYLKTCDLVVLEVDLETRINNTLNEYVLNAQKEHIDFYGESGLQIWHDYIMTSINKAKRRLGGERYARILDSFKDAHKKQLNTNSLEGHKDWIEIFLSEYYDPMYEYQIETTTKDIIFKGNFDEVKEYFIRL